MWGHMGSDWGAGWGWGGMGFGMLLFWGLLAVAIALMLKYSVSRGGGEGKSEKSALEILKERYARGEIDRDEYEQKKRDLSA